MAWGPIAAGHTIATTGGTAVSLLAFKFFLHLTMQRAAAVIFPPGIRREWMGSTIIILRVIPYYGDSILSFTTRRRTKGPPLKYHHS